MLCHRFEKISYNYKILNHRNQILCHNNETCVSVPAVEDMTLSVYLFFFFLSFHSFLKKYVFSFALFDLISVGCLV